jgi:hypothetical protein
MTSNIWLLLATKKKADNVVPATIDINFTCYSTKQSPIPMRPRLKGRALSPSFDRDKASLAENSKELLRCCLSSIHDLTGRYYYRISAEETIPGSLSYLLSIREVDLLVIFKICGFYNEKRGAFLFRVFETWVAASFDRSVGSMCHTIERTDRQGYPNC